jgi:hypothetical protein
VLRLARFDAVIFDLQHSDDLQNPVPFQLADNPKPGNSVNATWHSYPRW